MKIAIRVLLITFFAALIYAGSRPNQAAETPVVGEHQAVTKSADTAAGKKSEKTVKKYKVTFVELGSVRCIPCKMMQPVMKDVEKKYGKYVNVIFYDVWTSEGAPMANKYGIRGIPTQVFLDENGKEFFRHIGFYPEEDIVKLLNARGIK